MLENLDYPGRKSGRTPEEFGAFIRKETDKWGKTIREAGISVE